VRVEEGAPRAFPGQDGEVCEAAAPFLELGHDRVAEVGHEDRHGRHGDQAPDDEEAAPCVGLGRQVAVADGEQADVAEVQGLEVAQALRVAFGAPENDGAYAPEGCKGRDGPAESHPSLELLAVGLDSAHGVEPVSFFFQQDELWCPVQLPHCGECRAAPYAVTHRRSERPEF
jgi:hypothetical protein